MIFLRLFFLSYTLVFSIHSQAQSCYDYPLGISKYINESGIEITIAVSKVTADGSTELAASEARVNARALLLNDSAYKSSSGQLIGVIDVSTCIDGENVFAIVSVSSESIKQASKLNQQMKESMKNSPTPLPNAPQKETDMKSEYDRLIKK
jgi:hypothetical protein